MKAVAIVSGGLDSITLAHLLHQDGYELILLSFDYGQRHVKELPFAEACARRLGAQYHQVDLSEFGRLLKGSALTDDLPVPHGHYAAPSMAVTIVPNRNAIMLALAYGVAVAEQAEVVAAGVHAGDHPVYPDCRPEFIEAFGAMESVANEGSGHPGLKLLAPFLHWSKQQIVVCAARLGVPFEATWSCYEGGELHCGLCGTCVERREAFALSGIADPTIYSHPTGESS